MPLPQVDPTQYETQLSRKHERIERDFAEFDLPAIDLYRSPSTHYRMRAEFRVWHDGDDLYYVMFEPGDNRSPLRIDTCPMVSERIHSVMFELLDAIRPDPRLRFRLFQVDFLSTLSGELLVSLLYHRPIGEEWIEAVRPLRETFGIDIVGRSRKNKIVLERDYVIEQLEIDGRNYSYKQTENSFTQPNAEVCRQMIHWALDASREAGGDLVEFYCGNGNFTLPLAQNFRRVVATEISKESVRSARFNIEQNGIDNIDVLRMPSEDLSLVLKGQKETRKVNGLALDECEFTTVLVDPPRAGLDDETVSQVVEYQHILYISCNPETLRENLREITKTHRIERFAIFDQFPYTEHLECGVYLTRV
ncbi:tRNA/tmRNA (uracil-C(5))-methyltransferase [Marinobacterium zhoushanense]|uniref:tRNA/tmRNA (uracil-C(5))-methyltransferase n=1 Tax=Marinobacterium zhoushanense TaxID=1679163 RepID=A0ABQ1KM45_9GAMM|nr:tRNA (uridine(54)-C5)-methyltransferase TrmA [Marinobacterium zhoushanense]GGC01214.1 tRNA/tmRNA (uracil-C(5))-methyltransferase [Marinobacterium zhoushanense]